VALTAYHDGLASEVRIEQLLDGDENASMSRWKNVFRAEIDTRQPADPGQIGGQMDISETVQHRPDPVTAIVAKLEDQVAAGPQHTAGAGDQPLVDSKPVGPLVSAI